jgi:signal transduction histidine kinase
LSISPNLDKGAIVKHVIFNSHVGVIGATLAGIIAMIMSTADSWINSTSILIFNDFLKPLKIKFILNELYSVRIISIIVGALSLVLSLNDKTLTELLVTAYSFYMPIVTVPFIMAVLGFRSSENSVLIGMGSGFITVVIWDYILQIKAFNSVPFAMIVNLFVLIGYHYLLKQKGGWVGIKNNSQLVEIRKERKRNLKKLVCNIKNFKIIDFYKANFPQEEGLISIVGFFVMISVFSTTHTLAKEYYVQLLSVLYPITLCCSAILISYPLWLQSWKDTKLMGIIWNLILFFILICFGFFMVLISDFSEIQLMVFMINIVIISALSKWQVSLSNIVLGLIIVTFCYKYYYSPTLVKPESISSQFKIIYLLLLVSSTLVLFLRPKQEYLEKTEHKVIDLDEKVTHYGKKVIEHEQEIARLSSTSQKILNKVNHELRLPVGNVSNFSEMLYEHLGKSSDKYVQELSKELHKNSTRLSTMILNMLDLATLEVKKIDLQKRTINFSELVENRIAVCRKIYLQEKPLEFKLSIEPDVMIAVDANYIRQTIDNLVINAINFSDKGMITVSVQKKNGEVIFIIKDQGLGIPKEELLDVFEAFKMGSNTESKAEGRGIGLALCKSVIQAHGGNITAESNGEQGATLKFTLSLR